jgi:hypothetical protein
MPYRKMAHAGNPIRILLQLGQQNYARQKIFYVLTAHSSLGLDFVFRLALPSGLLEWRG